MLNGLDLFSGIGGLTLALSPWVRPVAYCENDRYAQGVLLSRMADGSIPRAPIWDDVRTLRGANIPRRIDIVYGGFPCQDISTAGLGAGLEGERSGLYFQIERLVSELRPHFVFLENVAAITFRGLEQVLSSLSAMGYDCRWSIVSAGSVGAAHLRERFWLLAHTNSDGLQGRPRSCQGGGIETREQQLPRFLPVDFRDARSITEIYGNGDGVPLKSHRIKCLGNSVVPLCAREAFKILGGLK